MKNNIEGLGVEDINIQETGIVKGSLEKAVGSAQTFDDLYVTLRTAGRVIGSGDKVYPAEDLINMISELRRNFAFTDEESKKRLKDSMSDEHVRSSLLYMITRFAGLQKKVAELMIKELC